jgi:hypothetical protein
MQIGIAEARLLMTVSTVVARGRSHSHCGSKHSRRGYDGLCRMEERLHPCRSDRTLTASGRNDSAAGSHLHDRGGHIAMDATAAERALAAAGDRSRNATSSAFPSVVSLYLQSKLLESSMLPLPL